MPDARERSAPGSSRAGGAPAWAVAWGATLLAASGSALALGLASVGAVRSALDHALAEQLQCEAGLAAAAVAPVPLESVIALDAQRSRAQLEATLADLARGARLHDVALLAPGVELSAGSGWVVRDVEQDLIARAAAGEPVVGTEYRGRDGALYRTAYARIEGHPGWVVGVEGSDATLAAVDRLEGTLWRAAVGALALAAVLAGLAASATSGPLRRLERDLAEATPDDAGAIAVQGPREVRHVALTAQALLASIHAGDLALREAHAAQMRQLETLAAAVAHEVRNPLHALGLTLDRLVGAEGPKRAVLGGRVRDRLDEIDGIVERFLALSRPIVVSAAEVDVGDAVRELLGEQPALGGTFDAHGRVVAHADPALVRQILRNLLRNAADAGARHVTVRARAAIHVELEVEDDGEGFSEGAEPFAWFATTRASGTGLGLPWSRRLAHAMGGDLVLRSARPAVLALTLPRAEAP